MMVNRITRLWKLIKQPWRPQRLKEPAIDPMFNDMDALERSAESIRYSILTTEFWISPDGQVREWCRHNTRLLAILFIPALVFIPIIGFALGQIAGWAIALTIIAGHSVIMSALLLGALLLILSIVKLIKSIF